MRPAAVYREPAYRQIGDTLATRGGLEVRTIPAVMFAALLVAGGHGVTMAANVVDLGVRVNGPNVRNGDVATFQIYVGNAGPVATNDRVTVEIDLPGDFSFVSGGGNGFSCAENGATVRCHRDTPIGQGSVDFPLRVNVCAATARISMIATVHYAADNNPASNRYSRGASVRPGACRPAVTATPTPSGGGAATPTPTASETPAGPPAFTDVSLSLVRAANFRAGTVAAYVVTVSNNGPVATSQPILVRTTLAEGMLLLASTENGWSCMGSGVDVLCSRTAALAARTSTSFHVNLRLARNIAPSITTIADVDYPGDTNPSNNRGIRPTVIRR